MLNLISCFVLLLTRTSGGLYEEEYVQKKMDRGDEVEELGGKLAAEMDPSGRDDISILAMQRIFNQYVRLLSLYIQLYTHRSVDHVHERPLLFFCSQPNGPATPVDMALDYFRYDYEFAEPPRATSLQNTEPTATFADFGEDAHFVADQRGFETLVYHIAGQYLSTDNAGNIVDPMLKLNKVLHLIFGKA
jgi:polyamine oxidase